MKRTCASALLLLVAAAAARAAATIMLLPTGAVDVRSGQNGQWTAVTSPIQLQPGQEVRTSKDSTAELRFSDGSLVQLARTTVFAIDKTDAKEATFSLSIGKLRAAFAGLMSSRVSIHTPTSVCAVRGTVFEMGSDPKGTEVTMAEGVLEVKDNKGQKAVINSEETLHIGDGGMDKPRLLSLSDDRALQAVRPYGVHQDMARDATRHMLEDLRNRELKANEAQLGKDVVDAFGRRVRLEEYLLRPAANSFELLFLSKRQDRFDWGHFIETFHTTIPDDLSQVPAIVQSGILAANQPSNWLKSFEFYATNTVDAEKEKILLGDPVQINFAGYNGGVAKQLWYPGSIDFTQTLFGPGVPGGQRDQFIQHQDFNAGSGLFTWTQNIVNNVGTMAALDQFQLNPVSVADVAATGCALGGEVCFDNSPAPINALGGLGQAQFAGLSAPVASYPNGKNKADLFIQTTYPDGSTVAVEKFLVSNDGTILDFANPTSGLFTQEGNYNLEINIKSSLYQGRDIDVLIAPEILRQKSQQTTTPDQPTFKP